MGEMTTEPEVVATHRHMSSSAAVTSSSLSVFLAVEESESALLSLLKASFIAFFPGAMQGATTVLLGHPLDTAKVRMQGAGPSVAKSTFGTMWMMTSTEGARSLYRGVAPPLIMEGAKRSLQFALWDWLRACSAADTGGRDTAVEGSHTTGAVSIASTVRHYGHQAVVFVGSNTFLSGALSGGFGTLIGCPMHVIKIQTQYQTARDTRNAWTCMREIYKREGVFGYYRGFRYNVLKDLCFAGTYLGLYATFRDKAWWSRSASTESLATALGTPRTSHLGAFLSGASASMATWVLLYPLDTVKTLVQARQAHAIPGMLRCPSRLYRGLVASLLKAGPVAGVSMAVYEQLWSIVNKTGLKE